MGEFAFTLEEDIKTRELCMVSGSVMGKCLCNSRGDATCLKTYEGRKIFGD